MEDIIKIQLATVENFGEESLLSFDRFQEVKTIYKLIDGKLTICEDSFTDDWSRARKIEKAREILSGNYITYLAFDGGHVVGEIMLIPTLDAGRMIVKSFHVSRQSKRQGIGRMLFDAARKEAQNRGARALYMSACSAKGTIDFYLAMGCNPSQNPIKEYAEDEPCDIQMECQL